MKKNRLNWSFLHKLQKKKKKIFEKNLFSDGKQKDRKVLFVQVNIINHSSEQNEENRDIANKESDNRRKKFEFLFYFRNFFKKEISY